MKYESSIKKYRLTINNPRRAAPAARSLPNGYRRRTMGGPADVVGDSSTSSSSSALTPRKKPPPKRFVKSQIPDSILRNEALNAAVSLLPRNYNFEIHRLLHRASTLGARHVTLQFPDGLLLFSLPISDILLAFAPSVADVSVLSDTSFGACCLDDLSARSLGSDLLVHFGHSCLVPISCSVVPAHYVFVEITIDVDLLVETLKLNFLGSGVREIILAGTIQFAGGIREAKGRLEELRFSVVVPQARPLSKGEVLGCTAPRVPLDRGGNGGIGKETVGVFVADGRFHMEAFMIANPGLKRVFRYDPYMGKLILEEYDQRGMRESRRRAIEKAKEAFREGGGGNSCWGIVLGTLGRQGNPRILERLEKMMGEKGYEYFVVLMSEISPVKIALFEDSVDAWIQIACPRLSIDWGESFRKPLLTPFEAEIALGYIPGWWERGIHTYRGSQKTGKPGCPKGPCTDCSCGGDDDNVEGADGDGIGDYPMDYYAEDGGDWNSCYVKKPPSARPSRRSPASAVVGSNA